MIISEKQIMQLMDYCRILANDAPTIFLPRKALSLLDKIVKQQSDKLEQINNFSKEELENISHQHSLGEHSCLVNKDKCLMCGGFHTKGLACTTFRFE